MSTLELLAIAAIIITSSVVAMDIKEALRHIAKVRNNRRYTR